MIDFGAWASEAYRIPADDNDAADAADDPRPREPKRDVP
jgi:endogenous inhibitor of DNA gyrase (YacG/DUF329 family)